MPPYRTPEQGQEPFRRLHFPPCSHRGSLELKLEELKPFVPPVWMTTKMRKYMETLRTEGEHLPPPEGTQEL